MPSSRRATAAWSLEVIKAQSSTRKGFLVQKLMIAQCNLLGKPGDTATDARVDDQIAQANSRQGPDELESCVTIVEVADKCLVKDSRTEGGHHPGWKRSLVDAPSAD